MAEHEGDRSLEALVAQNDLLRVENASLAAEIELLTRKIAELEQRLKKSSRNSSLPPSSDSPGERAEARQSRAERRAEERRQAKEAARRRGKQPGAEGQHLARRVDPDEIVVHEPEHCSSCAKELSSSQAEGFEARQVFDVPDPRLICTEHRLMRRRCSCGTVTTGTFPPEAKAPTCYGPNVRAATLHLLHGQHLSVERAAEAISAMLGVTVSTGFVASLAGEAAGGLVGFLGEVRERLRRAAVVHVDETPDQVRTDTWWFHVVANEAYTYLVASPTRGRAAPDGAGVLTDFAGVMVHDRLAMYFGYDKATHAICGAHLLRDLASVGVRCDQGWAREMAGLLCEMNTAAHGARAAGKARLGKDTLEELLASYDALAEAELNHPGFLGGSSPWKG